MNKDTSDNPLSHAKVVERNIRVLIERRKQDEQTKRWQDKIADKVTQFTGSMLFVLLHLILFSSWIIINLGWTPIPKFDPSFVVLAMFASVEAIFLSTFVLISQNRMAAISDKKAQLDLQISLLTEHEITRLITLVRQMARKMQIEESENPELTDLEKDVTPETVLDVIEKKEENLDQSKT